MTAADRIDIACGEASFVDVTFVGLDAVPGPGEERFAHDLLRSPGGAAIVAIGAARLGCNAALASPLGCDPEGVFLRGQLEAEGVRWAGRRVARTPITAVMPAGGERAMATFDPGEQVRAEELQAIDPRAVVLSLPRLALAPPAARLYATTGDEEARAAVAAGALPPELAHARALLVNEREALLLSGAGDAAEAARSLTAHAPRVVVTLGPDGALSAAAGEEEEMRVEGVPVEAVDTTGAGDLFAAAYVWADLNGASPLDSLRWAVLNAALSVRVATAIAGAPTYDELVAAAVRRGLTPLPRRGEAVTSTKEEA